jgi:nucleoid-associated protein YgaU
MSLREKYNHAIQTAKGVGMEGAAEERDGKLHFNGTVDSEEEMNKIWDALKTVPDWRTDISANIKVSPKAAVAGTSGATYTVQAGDTLSGIAKKHLGDGNAYMKIFEANRDTLTDPDKIRPGQVLRMP